MKVTSSNISSYQKILNMKVTSDNIFSYQIILNMKVTSDNISSYQIILNMKVTIFILDNLEYKSDFRQYIFILDNLEYENNFDNILIRIIVYHHLAVIMLLDGMHDRQSIWFFVNAVLFCCEQSCDYMVLPCQSTMKDN